MKKSLSAQALKPLLTILTLLALAIGFSGQAVAQFHGAGIVKQCEVSKVGDTTRCNIRVSSLDEFDDDIRVLEAYDEIDSAEGTVRDPESGNLPIVAVSGPTTCEVGGSLPCELLEEGASVTFASEGYVIQEGDGVIGGDGIRRVFDTARATYLDLCNGDESVDCNPVDIQELSAGGSTPLFEPSISVSKLGPDLAKLGDEVCWSIGFDNTSSANTPALQSCQGEDSFLGLLGFFEPGELREFCHTTALEDGGAIFNEVTISCGLENFDNEISDTANHTVELINPSIAVTKTGPDSAKVGDEVSYTIGFADTGTGTLENCTGTDDVLGDLGAFEAGVARTFSHTVDADDPNPLVNTATITCDVAGFDNQASDSDTHELAIFDPGVELTKLCSPDPVMAGDTIEWSLSVVNTGDAGLDCLLNDPEAGIVDEPVRLEAGETGDPITASRTVLAEDFPVISNTATVQCAVDGFDNSVNDEASADCEVEVPGEEICRTPGFWGTHAGTENRRSTNLTQMTIDAAGGELSVCGQTIDNTNVGNANSAVEAMCVAVRGQLERQLARQLTAMALNCVVSGGNADCSGTTVEGLFTDANAACIAGGGGPELGSWIDQVDCFNNGGQYIDGQCVIDPDDPANCQNRALDEASDIFDGVSPFPGPAGSPRACSSAINNGIKVVPAM